MDSWINSEKQQNFAYSGIYENYIYYLNVMVGAVIVCKGVLDAKLS